MSDLKFECKGPAYKFEAYDIYSQEHGFMGEIRFKRGEYRGVIEWKTAHRLSRRRFIIEVCGETIDIVKRGLTDAWGTP